MSTREKTISTILFAVSAAVCYIFFQTSLRYHFFFIEQSQLFLCDSDFLAEFFREPAWLSCMAGMFLQQFYHFPYLGAAVLTLCLLLFAVTLFAALRHAVETRPKRPPVWVAVIISIAAAAAIATLYLYENAKLATLLSLLGGVALWIPCRVAYLHITQSLPPRHTLLLAGMILLTTCSLCWWFFGMGVWVLLLLELISCIFDKRLPFAAAAAIILTFTLTGPAKTYPGFGRRVKYSGSQKVEHLLALKYEYVQGNYQKVIQLYERDPKTRTKECSLLYSLSISQLGMLPDKLATMREPVLGTFESIVGHSSLLFIDLMGEFYYLIGEMTFAERVALHVNSFSPHKRSAPLIRRLAEINLITGDEEAAEKYLRMLRKSFIYRKWAEEHSPGTMSAEAAAQIQSKRAFISTEDGLLLSNDARPMLLHLLNTNRNNVIALDYLLCTDILSRQQAQFYDDYDKYGPRSKPLYEQLTSAETRRIHDRRK